MTADITYTKGDATRPAAASNKIIVHICNDIGAWGKGFVMAISKRWPVPEQQYRQWHKSKTSSKFIYIYNRILNTGYMI